MPLDFVPLVQNNVMKVDTLKEPDECRHLSHVVRRNNHVVFGDVFDELLFLTNLLVGGRTVQPKVLERWGPLGQLVAPARQDRERTNNQGRSRDVLCFFEVANERNGLESLALIIASTMANKQKEAV